jgi:hypothetical protein
MNRAEMTNMEKLIPKAPRAMTSFPNPLARTTRYTIDPIMILTMKLAKIIPNGRVYSKLEGGTVIIPRCWP